MVDELLEAQRLASRLRRVRLERGLSLRGAAVQVGVTKETLSDLERARRHPHHPTLAKIAKGYDVEISDLLGPMVEEPALAGTSQGKGEASETGPKVVKGSARIPLPPEQFAILAALAASEISVEEAAERLARIREAELATA
jgi:transcriptional regulator with XRE-family HTH domain